MKTILALLIFSGIGFGQFTCETPPEYVYGGCPDRDPVKIPPPVGCEWVTVTDDQCVTDAEIDANMTFDDPIGDCVTCKEEASDDWDTCNITCSGPYPPGGTTEICQRNCYDVWVTANLVCEAALTAEILAITLQFDINITTYCCSYTPDCGGSKVSCPEHDVDVPAVLGIVMGAPTFNGFVGPTG